MPVDLTPNSLTARTAALTPIAENGQKWPCSIPFILSSLDKSPVDIASSISCLGLSMLVLLMVFSFVIGLLQMIAFAICCSISTNKNLLFSRLTSHLQLLPIATSCIYPLLLCYHTLCLVSTDCSSSDRGGHLAGFSDITKAPSEIAEKSPIQFKLLCNSSGHIPSNCLT